MIGDRSLLDPKNVTLVSLGIASIVAIFALSGVGKVVSDIEQFQ